MESMTRLASVLVAALAVACADSRPALRSSPLVGKPAEFTAEDLGGATVHVANDGGRVRIVDFWATWCDPCRDLMPVLERIHRKYSGQGVSVYGVSFDEDRAMLQAFLEKNPVSYAILWDKGGARLGEPLDVYRLPTTLVVDKAGIVRFAHVGFDSGEPEKLEREVRRLLAE